MCNRSDRREPQIQNIASHPAEGKDIEEKQEKQLNTERGKLGYACIAEVHSNCVGEADKEKDQDGETCGDRKSQEIRQDAGEEGGGDGEGGGGSCNQRKHRQQVDQMSGDSVCVTTEKGAAGLGIFLLFSSSDMQHEPEGRSHRQIHGPGNRSPVKQRIGAGPALEITEGLNIRFVRINDPLAERVEHNVCGKPGGENHGAPLQGGKGRCALAEPYCSVAGTGDVKGEQEDGKSCEEVVPAELL